MNPFQRLGVKISNWWRGEPQNDGGKNTLGAREDVLVGAWFEGKK